MPLSSTKRRLKELWKRRRILDAKIDVAIKRRLRRFQRGSISSEEFEKVTREERNFAKLNEKIIKFENKRKTRLL